jgi:macrocin-O-methyltransferase TylF-like protien
MRARLSPGVPRMDQTLSRSSSSETVVSTPKRVNEVFDKKVGAKILLARLGSVSSPRLVYNLNGAFNYLHVGWWLRAHGFRPRVHVRSRYEPRSRAELFQLIAAEVAEREVLYLEFGVAAGNSMRQWSELLRNPRSSLHGFDSFLGLPHDWSLEGHQRGTFSTGGRPPEIDDPRVQFFTGWFKETLPSYRWPEHEVLVVVMDADLYSSTKTALEHVKPRLLPGSFLYFDQFHHRCDELRAFAELLEENGLRFDLVAASSDLSKVVFKRLA